MKVSPPAFVGREAALATLTDALTDPPALVLVEGEAGIGKTRMVQECLAAPSMRDRLVVYASCPPLPEPFPLGPVVDGLRLLRERVAAVELSPLGGALRPIFPEWAAELPPALEPLPQPLETRHRLFRALIELVERLGVDVLVIEDAHWADHATLEWLLTLSASAGHKTSVVVTYRPFDIPRGSPLLRLTSRTPVGMRRVHLALEPLDIAQTHRLVASMFDVAEVSADFVAFLHEHTGGIPLVVEESVLLMSERRDIIRSGKGWSRRVIEELRVPPTLRDSVLERVERLTPATRAVLEAAAVLGAPASEELLAAVADLEERAIREGVAGALASGLLREAERGTFTFRHVLASKAVEDAVPAPIRRHLHRRAGEALRTMKHPPVVRLSRHFREAGDIAEWSRYAQASARLAMESGDDHTALAMLCEVLTGGDHPPERRAELARQLGTTATLGTDSLSEMGARVMATLKEVLADPGIPPGDRGEIRLHLGRLHLHMEEYAAGTAALEAAVPDLGDRPALAAQAMLYLALPLSGNHPADWHRQWLKRAAPLLADIHGPVERVHYAANRALALLLFGEEEGWRVAETIPHTAPTRVERQEIIRSRLNIAQLATLWGRYGDAGQRLAEVRDLLEETDFRRVGDTLEIALARLNWYTGAWKGLRETVSALTDSARGTTTDQAEAHLLYGELDLAEGAVERARRRLSNLLAQQARRGNTDPFVIVAAPLARISLSEGRPDEALKVTTPVLDMIVCKAVWLWAADILPVHVAALVAAERLDDARRLVGLFYERLAGRDAPAAVAALATCRGALAEGENDPSRAAVLYGEAALAWAALPRPYDELRAVEQQGRCLLAAGDRRRGLAALSDAHARLLTLGARWDASRVARILRDHGVGVATAWRGGRRGYGDRLSPRELEVVRLVAQGRTNRMIAEALFLSPRTVDRHLSTAMRKLSVSTRTALVAAVRDAGLPIEEPDDTTVEDVGRD